MKKKVLYLTILVIFSTFFALYLLSESSLSWDVPEILLGTWCGKQKVTIHIQESVFSYSFLKAPDSVNLIIRINEDGNIKGSLGSAIFNGCRISKNRGWLGKKLNLATDFIIKGTLVGSIFNNDTITIKGISFPFNCTSNRIKGTIFQMEGVSSYPMTDIEILKQ